MTDLYVMGLLLLILVLMSWRISSSASKNPANKFDLGEAFTDDNGKTSMARVSLFVALIVSTWALVSLVITNRLTEWFYMAYLGAFVLNGVGSKLAERKQDKPE